MRFFVTSFLTLSLALAALPATAQGLLEPDEPMLEPVEPDAGAIQPPAGDVPVDGTTNQSRIDELFGQLARTPDTRRAKTVADSIWSEWFRSGSPTIDLMLHWSNEAIGRQEYNIAMDFLDQIVTRRPDFAEGWNRRATLHFVMENYAKSMTDIEKVLEIEPRHFGALAGMANILERSGNKRAALAAWERALAVYPAMKTAQDAVIRLNDELAGEPA